MARVTLERVDKHYGAVRALAEVSLEIEDGEFAVFVGPSGCGKSTLLRSVAGLETISGGRITIGEDDVTAKAPSERGVAMVFQSYALYPHMSVRANMEFGMKVNNVPRAERLERIREAARILQLEDYLDRRPAQLSGGQRQRVAIGRAIVKEPRVFLFDEPLSNLDAKLRIQMRVELETLHKALGSTMIYVTHDQVEAMTMADKIVVLNGGRVEQVGPPLDLYHEPESAFVAGFIGSPSMNFLAATAEPQGEGITLVRHGHRSICVEGFGAARGPVQLGMRPEHCRLVSPGTGFLEVEIEVVEQLGGENFLHARTADDQRVTIRTDGETRALRGERVGLEIAPGRVHLFAGNGLSLKSRRVPG